MREGADQMFFVSLEDRALFSSCSSFFCLLFFCACLSDVLEQCSSNVFCAEELPGMLFKILMPESYP